MSPVTSLLDLACFEKQVCNLYVIATREPEVKPFRTENGEYGSVGPLCFLQKKMECVV